MKKVVIIGCGDIGQRVAALYQQQGANVAGLAHSEATRARLKANNIQVLDADLDDAQTLSALPTQHAEVFYFAPPPKQGVIDSRIRDWLNSLTAANQPNQIVLISTTAVYGDSGGEWVTEQSPTQPGTDRGRRRLDAELAVTAYAALTGVPVVILRVPGIYGPGRLPRERIEQGLAVLAESESGYTNRIHADDLANICLAAAQAGRSGEIYNVSDGKPGTMTEWFTTVAEVLGLPPPPVVTREQAQQVMTPGMLSYLSESRRIDNTKMREQLKVGLMYGDVREGILASINK